MRDYRLTVTSTSRRVSAPVPCVCARDSLLAQALPRSGQSWPDFRRERCACRAGVGAKPQACAITPRRHRSCTWPLWPGPRHRFVGRAADGRDVGEVRSRDASGSPVRRDSPGPRSGARRAARRSVAAADHRVRCVRQHAHVRRQSGAGGDHHHVRVLGGTWSKVNMPVIFGPSQTRSPIFSANSRGVSAPEPTRCK